MCGIVGYVGSKQAAPILMDGLRRLEYRGYDSAGLAVRQGNGRIEVVKAKGRLAALAEKIDGGRTLQGTCGIGHTRWATHGEPSERNAHPHCSDDYAVVAVHNGIIENHQELREKLEKNGYRFYSETDTEVAVKLVDYYYKKYKGGPVDALSRSMMRIRGSYALAVLFADFPEEIYAARKDSPMIIGAGEGEMFLASDVPALLKHTREVYYIGNLEIARLTKEGAAFYNIDGESIEKEKTHIEWDAEAAEKAGFEHFMMKEIHEQPKAVRDTLHAYVKEDGTIDFSAAGLDEAAARGVSRILMVACGSAYHVCVTAQYVIEDLAGVPVRTELASEFRYRRLLLQKDELVIIVSQSGETADSLAALREAKRQGNRTLAIVNVVGSSIAREADSVLYTLAGPEIAVATTKAFSTQVLVCNLLAIFFARARGEIDAARQAELLAALSALPEKMERLLEEKERIQWFAAKFAAARDAFFIGRGLDYAICMEGGLKMKEISYVHSEAYAAGELKHGTISLIEPGTLVICLLTQSALYEKMVSNMAEVKSRGAYLMGLTNRGNYGLEDTADFTVYIPSTDEHFAPSLAVIPLQLLGYYISVARGLDVDKPRNLAKSVTVE